MRACTRVLSNGFGSGRHAALVISVRVRRVPDRAACAATQIEHVGRTNRHLDGVVVPTRAAGGNHEAIPTSLIHPFGVARLGDSQAGGAYRRASLRCNTK